MSMKIEWGWKLKSGLRYYFSNTIVNRIPSWTIRKFFYKILGLKIGKGSRIGLFSIVDFPRGISIGENSIINQCCFLDGRGGLSIGNNVSISIYTKIITSSHKVNSSTFEYYESKVEIRDNVWIGTGAIILDGSVVNKRAVIGAGAVLKGTAEESGIYIGNPCELIKKRNLENDYEIIYLPWCR